MINWNKYQSKIVMQAQKLYFDHMNDPSFQGLSSNCRSKRLQFHD